MASWDCGYPRRLQHTIKGRIFKLCFALFRVPKNGVEKMRIIEMTFVGESNGVMAPLPHSSGTAHAGWPKHEPLEALGSRNYSV